MKGITRKETATAAQIAEWINYDPESGLIKWIKSGHTRPHSVGKVAGTPSNGYVQIRVGRKLYKAHRLAWLLMTGEWPPDLIDHIDGDGLNNKWRNLRVADRSLNGANSKRHKHNKSGFKGVFWESKKRVWQARIVVKGKQKHLGFFADVQDAAEAYRHAAVKEFGGFARFQ